MNNKRYHVVFKLWTGSWFMNGELCYGTQVEVRSNSLDYVFRIRDRAFSEIDIYCGKVHIFDLNGNFDTDTDGFYNVRKCPR